MQTKRYIKKKFIYYTVVYDGATKERIDERLSFSPNQFVQLKAIHGENNVKCVRMDMVTGEWKTYPLAYARK